MTETTAPSFFDAIAQAGRDEKLLPTTVENLNAWVTGGFLPAWAEDSLSELVNAEEWEELNDRFYKYMAFGTGGMRGRTMGKIVTASERGTPGPMDTPAHPSVGTAYLNDFNIIRATIGLFRYCERHLAKKSVAHDIPKIVIAHDVRHFSRHFTELAASTWTRLGGHALIFEGPRSTPQLSFSVRYLGATAGVVITASHNPPHDNGFKAYFEDGAQVTPPHDKAIIEEVNAVALGELGAFLEKKMEGVVTLGEKADAAYAEALAENIIEPNVIRENKPRVVFTSIHGTGGVASIPALEKLEVDVVTTDEQEVQDPRFPTVKSPNPENAEALEKAIARADTCEADLVLATDPDSDRMGAAVRGKDGEMHLITGNMIGSILAEYRIEALKRLKRIPEQGSPNAALIKTFVTTPMQDAIGHGHGLKVINTLTGFKWIGSKLREYEEKLVATMAETRGLGLDYDATHPGTRRKLLLDHSTFYVFGGEESYGYLASDRVRDKDANAAVLMFCEVAAALKAKGETFLDYLDKLYLKYGYYLEDLLNIYYEGASGAGKIKNIINSYRSDTPKEFSGYQVTGFTDFANEDIVDDDGTEIPKQDFYMLELDNGYKFAVRGSGTEPKIKFYLFAKEDVAEPARLADIKQQVRTTLDSLKDAIEEDARKRAEG